MSSTKIVLDISARIAYNSTVKAIAITWFAWPLRNGRCAVTSEGGKYKCRKSMCVRTNPWRAP